MKIILNSLGVICVALGALLFFQGMKIIKIGIMAGHRRWIVIGVALIIGGGVILIFMNRPKIGKSKP
jgi:hypothetical protein